MDNDSEEIIAANYWENWKYAKELNECLGAKHIKSIKQNLVVSQILNEWNNLKEKSNN